MNKYITTIKTWFNRPFPFSETSGSKIRTSVLFGLFIFLFLAFFQPFNIVNISQYKYLYLSGFGLITFICMLINYFILPIMPVIVLTLVLERQLWKKHSLVAQNISERLEKQKGSNERNESISLTSENTKESFQLPQNQLICIGSEGNYSKVYYRSQGKIKERLMRMPLKKVEELLNKFDNIVRCHRFYIVNLPSIASVSGNARSFKLHMTELDFTIPVFRSFPKAMIEQLKIEQV